MRVDVGPALAPADPGVTRAELEAVDERVATAHERIEAGVADDEFGYAALDLPHRTDAADLDAGIEPVSDADTVLTVGIGGSALGAKTVAAALGAGDRAPILDNVDPDHAVDLLDSLPLGDTAVHVVSRSGRTAETLANFEVVCEAFERAGLDWTARTVVTTGPDGPLRDLADHEGLPTFDVPEGVPGRFSAFSTVGLAVPAILGVDVANVLAGATEAADDLAGSLFECPGYAYGATAHALGRRGAHANVLMPYAERLEPFAEWAAQLFAESLGKEGLGTTPVRALGVTDQHSQLQLYRAGPRDKFLTLVEPVPEADVEVPAPGHPDLAHLADADLGDLLDAEFAATAASLVASRRPHVRIDASPLDARALGALLYGMEAACVLAGELSGVDAFDQPAVEYGKQATRDLLGEADADLADADSLVIE